MAGTRADIDSEFLHDLRVAVRRTRSALTQIKGVFPPEDVERFKSGFAWLGQITGPTRDMDVYLLGYEEYRDSLQEQFRGDLDPLHDFLLAHQKSAHQELVKKLNSPHFHKLLKDWRTFLETPLNDVTDTPNAERPLQEVANRRIYRIYKRVLEEGLINAGIPYRVYGGLRFFERMEIKDALAYLRLTANRDDDSSFERIVNKPTRGIGARTVELMRSYARANACSLWRAAGAIASDDLNGRAANAVSAFMSLIERLARETRGLDLHDQVDHVIYQSGLVDFFKKDKGEKGETRVENLLELVSAAKSFEPDPAEEMSPLDEGFRQRLDYAFRVWQDVIEETLERAQQKGHIRGDVNCDETATFIIAALEGCIGIAKNAQSMERLHVCNRGLIQFIRSLQPQ